MEFHNRTDIKQHLLILLTLSVLLFYFQKKRTISYPNATEIRRNPNYYTLYCVGLNTCFATLLPLSALIFFNCMTLRALRILGNAAVIATSAPEQDGTI